MTAMSEDQPPPEAWEDCFHPPSISTLVHCIHCNEEYDSWRIEWREFVREDGTTHGFWCCPIEGCGGAGFGFDIFPVDPNYIDPDGRDMGEWVETDDEEIDDDDEDGDAEEDWDEEDDGEFEWPKEDDDEDEAGESDTLAPGGPPPRIEEDDIPY